MDSLHHKEAQKKGAFPTEYYPRHRKGAIRLIAAPAYCSYMLQQAVPSPHGQLVVIDRLSNSVAVQLTVDATGGHTIHQPAGRISEHTPGSAHDANTVM